MDIDDSEDQNNRMRMNFIQKIGDHEQWNNVGEGFFFVYKWWGGKKKTTGYHNVILRK